jgi:hypothetical protein
MPIQIELGGREGTNQIPDLASRVPAELPRSLRGNPRAQQSPSAHAEPQSDVKYPNINAESGIPIEQRRLLATAEDLALSCLLTKNAEAEELNHWKEHANRLEERRKRSQELNEIEEEKESVRERMASLAGRSLEKEKTCKK